MTSQRLGRILSLLLVAALIVGLGLPALVPARAQGDCGTAPPPRLTPGGQGSVLFTDGRPVNVRDGAGLNANRIGSLPEGAAFSVLAGPTCADSIYWWQVSAPDVSGWIAEGMEGEYFVGPASSAGPSAPGGAMSYDWAQFLGDSGSSLPDPLTIQPPAVYQGDLPALPLDLTNVRFLEDAGLSPAQSALLAQNGFVVVPGGFQQFDEAYRETETWWTVPPDFSYDADPATQGYGHAFFVTTDGMLHALRYIFDNLLTDVELTAFVPIMREEVLIPALQAAHAQTQELAGTPLEQAAADAELYLAIGLDLLQEPGMSAAYTSPEIAAQVQTVSLMAWAGEGQYEVPFLPGYTEDFSQYRPRGHYAGDMVLEGYFRSMMWLSRITFVANEKDPAPTQMALLLLRALRSAPNAYQRWQDVHATLTFLIGPIDDLSPLDYAPLADELFGSDVQALADPAKLAAFFARVKDLPAPRVNGVLLPADTQAEDMPELTRGFRFMGQRFTLDAYLMQQLMYPYVGTYEQPRGLPLGLDVPAVLGSETAYTLAGEAGATEFEKYDTQIAALRQELGALPDATWLENTYSAWLWTLKPLFARDAASYPPLMQTEAWLRKDLQTGLASWTELKHDTILYVKQPTGFGGGGPPLTSFGYVEPNPLVFARIAVVATMTYQGLTSRNLIPVQFGYAPQERVQRVVWQARQSSSDALDTDLYALRDLAREAGGFAQMAQHELEGQPLAEEDYWSILLFGTYLNTLLRTLYQGEGDPDPVALVTDVASNPDMQLALQEGVGSVDLIYVVVPAPDGGTQLVRGGVFSYYEFLNNINQRMTDQEWRAKVAAGDLPPRPDWISAFYSE